jgi:poly-gamma-glutamate synthesis protein (capsule biosynthesis protein)
MIRLDVETASWVNPANPNAGDFRLLVAGDFCPARGYALDEVLTRGADACRGVYGDMLGDLADKDLSIVNLELALSDSPGEAIIKDGPALAGPVGVLEALTAGRFDAVNLANNHVLDFGPDVLMQTIQAVRDAGLASFGAGENRARAYEPLFVQVAGRNVGLLAFAETEFSSATRTTPGTCPLEGGANAAAIAAAAKRCDLLIVFVHGGNEHCPVASPRMVREYRSFIDAGADAVIGGHAHTVQGMELYAGRPIIYNIGNFLFWVDPAHADPLWWYGFLPRLHFAGRTCTRIDAVPYRLDAELKSLRRLTGNAASAFVERLNRLSEIIADPELGEWFWNAWCLDKLDSFLGRIRETRDGFDRDDLRPLAAAHLRNLFTCQAHHEAISTALELVRQDRPAEPHVADELAGLLEPDGF